MRSPCVYNRGEKWLCAYWDENGKRHDKVFGIGPNGENAAKAFKSEFEAKNRSNADDITFEQGVNAFVKNCESQGTKAHYIDNIIYEVNRVFYKYIPKTLPLKDISYGDHILPILAHYRKSTSKSSGKELSSVSVNNYCSMLKTILNFCVDIGYISKNPMEKWKKERQRPRRFKLSLEDLALIKSHAAPHVSWAIDVTFNLGLRPGPSELFSLKWEHINFTEGYVTVHGTKTEGAYRIVPIKKEFLEVLKRKQSDSTSEYVIEYLGKPVKSISVAFRNAVKRSGLNYKPCLYDLRHMFATFMLANGADLAAVSKLLGHSSIKMTADVYYQYLQGEKIRAVSLLPTIPSLPKTENS